MFDLSFSDEGASGGDTSQLFHTVLGSSPVTSPPLAMDHDDGFILDNNLFDIVIGSRDPFVDIRAIVATILAFVVLLASCGEFQTRPW